MMTSTVIFLQTCDLETGKILNNSSNPLLSFKSQRAIYNTIKINAYSMINNFIIIEDSDVLKCKQVLNSTLLFKQNWIT